MRFVPSDRLRELFLSKFEVDLRTGCWLWTGTVGKDTGYGSFRGQNASRAAWLLFVGPIPAGLYALHHCDTPLCVNWVDCLFLGTQRENVHDMRQKGRSRDPSGAAVGSAKLTEADVQVILEVYRPRDSEYGLIPLARRFKVGPSAINAIISGRGWAHIPRAVPAKREHRLTNDEVQLIRRLHKRGDPQLGSAALAKRFGVGHELVNRLIRTAGTGRRS